MNSVTEHVPAKPLQNSASYCLRYRVHCKLSLKHSYSFQIEAWVLGQQGGLWSQTTVNGCGSRTHHPFTPEKIHPLTVSGSGLYSFICRTCLIGSRLLDSADVLSVPNSSKLFFFNNLGKKTPTFYFFCFFLNRWILVQQNQLLQKNRSVKSGECFCSFLNEERKNRCLWPCFQKRWGTNYLKWRKNRYCCFDVAINSLLPEASSKFIIFSTGFWARALGCLRELNATSGQGAPT